MGIQKPDINCNLLYHILTGYCRLLNANKLNNNY
jgi:hypothetical protein